MAIDLRPIFALSTAEKIELVQDLWDDIAAHPEDVPFPEWLKDELDRREANLAANPGSAQSWDDMVRSIRERHGR